MRPDPETIRSLVAFLEKEGLEEVCYEDGGARIRVRREPTASPTVSVGPAAAVAALVIAPPKSKPPPPPSPTRPAACRDLLSPMAGIFYRASSPGAEPFVKVGEAVEAGQTVGLVEAMKTFNEVAAETAGRVLDFYVQDTEAVRAGQPILALLPLEVET